VSTYLSPLVTMDATLNATLVAALDSKQRLSHIS
jgi:hypothetical protein